MRLKNRLKLRKTDIVEVLKYYYKTLPKKIVKIVKSDNPSKSN